MALVSLEIPKVGLVMENARLVRWLKSVGDLVKQGEPLLELETEKSVVEIESTESGRLVEILLQVDQDVRVGDRAAWLENDLSAACTGSSGHRNPRPAAQRLYPAHPVSQPVPVPARNASGPAAGADKSNDVPSSASAAMQHPVTGRVKSSPVARRLAAQNSLDLRRSGRNGSARTRAVE